MSEKRMRVLVTGAGGLVGGRVAEVLALGHGFAVVAARHLAPGPTALPEQPLDLTSTASIEAAVDAARPEAIVHAAALADADQCEADPARAEALNVRAPDALARRCRTRGIRLVVFSTDLVFRGDRPHLAEGDAPGPILVYGRTKLAGEEAVLAGHPEAVIVRLALISGRGHGPKATATEAVAWALRSGRRLRLYTDQHRTPVDPDSVADAVAVLIRGRQSGRFHLGGPERLSRYELGLRVARVLGLPPDGIEPAHQREHVGPARPADVSLDAARARIELGFAPRSIDAAIAAGRPQAARL